MTLRQFESIVVHGGVDRTPIILLVASLGPKLLWDELNFQYWTREEDNCVFRRLEVQTGTSSSSRSRTRAWLDFFIGENPVAGWIFQMGDVNKWLVRTVMGNIDVQCWRHLQTYLHKKYRNWCQHTYCKSWYIYEWAQAESKPIQPFLTTRQVSNIKNINFYSLFPILPIWWWTTPRLNIGRGISISLSCKQSYLLDTTGMVDFPLDKHEGCFFTHFELNTESTQSSFVHRP